MSLRHGLLAPQGPSRGSVSSRPSVRIRSDKRAAGLARDAPNPGRRRYQQHPHPLCQPRRALMSECPGILSGSLRNPVQVPRNPVRVPPERCPSASGIGGQVFPDSVSRWFRNTQSTPFLRQKRLSIRPTSRNSEVISHVRQRCSCMTDQKSLDTHREQGERTTVDIHGPGTTADTHELATVEGRPWRPWTPTSW